ncbi:hypothetical protein A2W24_03325 [Microgenomates group bacterium RBG_16_45_19]|nr:MAG: hypothetical protein A2W24_03325 [Microgenomates group bacterium RBG_16_45_19]
MAKRRTRKDKVQARHSLSYTWQQTTPLEPQVYDNRLKPTQLPQTATRLIQQDLGKSLLIALLIILIEMAIFWVDQR